MKFMIQWRVHEHARKDTMRAFAQMTEEDDRADIGDNIRLIGRWHDMANFTGVAIFETDDPMAAANWALNWNSVMDCEVSMVLDDNEARALGRARIEAEAAMSN